MASTHKSTRALAALAASAGARRLRSASPKTRGHGPADISVRVAAVRDGALQGQPVSISPGPSSHRTPRTVGATTAGRVVVMNVRVGDHVSIGEVLAQVDAAGYRAQLAQAQSGAQAAGAQTAAADAQVAAAQSQLHLAEVTATRMTTLYREGAISRQDYDQTEAICNRLAPAWTSAAGSSAASRGRSGAFRRRRGERSGQRRFDSGPVRGTIVARTVDVGSVVGPGAPVVTIENGSDLELNVALPNDAGARARPGDAVWVRVDSLGKTRFADTSQQLRPPTIPRCAPRPCASH